MWPSQLNALVNGHQRFNGVDQQQDRRNILAGLKRQGELQRRRNDHGGGTGSQSQDKR
jgi:hypothetical protein